MVEGKTKNGGEWVVNLRWEAPNNMPFSMPVDIVSNGKTHRVEMNDGKGSFSSIGPAPVVDPDGWVLKAQ